MNLCLRISHFRFVYAFESGHKLIGTVKGDSYTNAPDIIFNLRALRAVCLNHHGNLVMGFDQVFGQFTLQHSEALLTGTQVSQGSFFSFNYRDNEASIYDATRNIWLATGWNPDNWHVQELVKSKSKALPLPISHPSVRWDSRAIA